MMCIRVRVVEPQRIRAVIEKLKEEGLVTTKTKDESKVGKEKYKEGEQKDASASVDEATEQLSSETPTSTVIPKPQTNSKIRTKRVSH